MESRKRRTILEIRLPREIRKPCFGHVSARETAIANIFVSVANMVIFAIGIVEYIPRSHPGDEEPWKLIIRPFMWGYYYFFWSLEIYLSIMLWKAAKNRNSPRLKIWLMVEGIFFAVWLILFATHALVLKGFQMVLQACFSVLALYKLYTFWIVWSFREEVEEAIEYGWNDPLKNLSAADIEDFRWGRDGKFANFSHKPFNKDLEIQAQQLGLIEVIGQGLHSTVFKATFRPLPATHCNGDPHAELLEPEADEEEHFVAVKRIYRADYHSFKAVLNELKIMSYIGEHLNIVTLIGARTADIEKRELDVVLEYCPNSSLDKFLQLNQGRFKNHVLANGVLQMPPRLAGYTSLSDLMYNGSLNLNGHKQAAAASPPPSWALPFNGLKNYEQVTTEDLIRWSLDVAKGMEYLNGKSILHGDLSLRNVVLSSDKVAKVADFGFSQSLCYTNKPYVVRKMSDLPWRWMAPESLMTKKAVVMLESDIWSYGVTLYEMFTLGNAPYTQTEVRNVTDLADFVQQIKTVPLEKPPFASNDIYERVMLRCWKLHPYARIKWPHIVAELQTMLNQPPTTAIAQVVNVNEVVAQGGFFGKQISLIPMRPVEAVNRKLPNPYHQLPCS